MRYHRCPRCGMNLRGPRAGRAAYSIIYFLALVGIISLLAVALYFFIQFGGA